MDHNQSDHMFFADPRIGTSDVDTWRAIPWETIQRDDEPWRGGYCIVAGDCDEADVYIEVTAEHPDAVAEFIVQAVRNEWARIQEAAQQPAYPPRFLEALAKTLPPGAIENWGG